MSSDESSLHLIVELIDHKRVVALESENNELRKKVKLLEDQMLSLEFRCAGLSSQNLQCLDILRSLGYKDLSFLGHVESNVVDSVKALCDLIYIPEI